MNSLTDDLRYCQDVADRLGREHLEYHENTGSPNADASTCRLCKDVETLKATLPAARLEIDRLRELARIISAEPELLEALQKAVKDYGREGGPWNVPSEPGAWLDMARRAISKAVDGEQSPARC